MRGLVLLLLCVPLLAGATPPEVKATPARVLLGRERRVTLEVRVPEGTGPVRAVASSGTFAQAVVEGGAVRTFLWTPPEVRYPLTAVLLFWQDSAAGGPPEVARVRLPLLGSKTLDVATKPGAEVVVEIGEAQFGPVRADKRGKARVPVEVPPNVKHARVLATRRSQRTDLTVPLEVPPHQPLVALLSTEPLSSEKDGWLVVAGEPEVDSASLRWSAQGARVEPHPGAPGLFRVRPEPGATRVSVEVRRPQGSEVSRVSASVQPPPPEPTREPAPPLVAVAPPPSPTVAVEPPAAPSRHLLGFHVLAGGFFAGGANHGPAAAVGASFQLPFWGERLGLELEAGLREVSVSERTRGFGLMRSKVLAGPLLASARLTALELGPLSLSGRVGGGLMPFSHRVSSELQAELEEQQLVSTAFVAVQGAYRLGRLSVLVEVRGAHAPVHTQLLEAQLGGVSGALGVRFVP